MPNAELIVEVQLPYKCSMAGGVTFMQALYANKLHNLFGCQFSYIKFL